MEALLKLEILLIHMEHERLLIYPVSPKQSIKNLKEIDAFKANGHETHLCYMDESSTKQRFVDKQVIANYGDGIKGKILKRTEFGSIVDYAIKQKIDFVYIRSNHNANPFTI